MRGEASADVREAVNSAQRDAQDAIDRVEVPRQYHGAVKQYFDRLAGLIRDAQQAAPKATPAGQGESPEK